MHIAAQKGHAETIRVLKALGADVNTPMKDGATPVCAQHHVHIGSDAQKKWVMLRQWSLFEC